ncbi:MAG: IS66 family transposase [Nitrososphaerales archaeon]
MRYYENHNSPPSADSLLWKKMKREKKEKKNKGNCEPKKPGRKNGHKGITHSFKPTQTIEHTLDRCNRCGSPDITFSHHDNRTIVDIPEPEPYTVTLHKVSIYNCNKCGSEIKPDADIPEQGMPGKNLLAMISSLWHVRLTIGKIQSMLEAIYGLRLSTATIQSALLNVSSSLQRFADRVRSNIKRSKCAGFDETGISINGKRGWVWCAVSGKNAFITVEKSRGADVIEKYFHNFHGIAIVDGWRAYNKFKQQRCWAHIIREADTLALRTKSSKAKELAEYIRNLYHHVKSELEEHPPPNTKLCRSTRIKLGIILSRAGRCRDKDVRKFVEKVKSASSKLFTFIMHYIDSTNNACERILREAVIHRKVRGLLRNGKGMSIFGNIMTAFMTWKLRGLNPLEEMGKYL